MTTGPEHIDAVAEMLALAEDTSTPIDAIVPATTDLTEGYAIQAAGHRIRGHELVAWKAGVTNVAAQKFLGLDEPVAGRLGAQHVLPSGSTIRVSDFATPPQLEVEVGFRLSADVGDAVPDFLELADVVDAVAAIEVVSGRVSTFPLLAPSDLVADNVVAGRIIVGSSLGLDVAAIRGLDSIPVSLEIAGEQVAAGTGEAALGHPLRVLSWLAGHARAQGAPLRSGDLVITGTCTGMTPVRTGSRHAGLVGGTSVLVGVD